MTQSQNADLFGKYVNPGLKTLLSIVGFDRAFTRAHGIEIYDERGNRYYDFLGGYGSLPFGHGPKDILEAVDKANGRPQSTAGADPGPTISSSS